jgi:flagella basal body P-ring formation protein FlgA
LAARPGAFLSVVLISFFSYLSSPATAWAQAANASPRAAATTPANSATPDLTQRIQDFLSDKASAWPGTLHADVKLPDLSRYEACSQYEIFLPGRASLRMRMSVGIRCAAPQPWTTYAQVSVSIEGIYYVTSRALDADTPISLEDLAKREGDLLRLPPDTVLDPAQLVGFITTQRLNARNPIRASALRSPNAIMRGQNVRIEVHGNGFVATNEGRALENGEPGNRIQVKTTSGQIVTGTVVNSHTVLIPF